MATILITGGTGLIGKALTRELLYKGFQVIILTRDTDRKTVATPGLSFAGWNIGEGKIDTGAIAKADYIIHLAGAGVADKRWTANRKAEIVDSRVKSAELIARALNENKNDVKAVVSISGIGWYGPDARPGERPFVETDPPYTDFLSQTCKQWEGSIAAVTQFGKRLVILRTGIVLANEGGAFAEFKKPLNFGIATVLGNGKQVVSWIHIDDLVRLFIFALENQGIQGVYNAVAPMPVTNQELILRLARQRQRFYIPVKVPAFVLKAVLGEMSIEVLKSATVSCQKIQSAGFTFQHPSIKSAIGQLTGSGKPGSE